MTRIEDEEDEAWLPLASVQDDHGSERMDMNSVAQDDNDNLPRIAYSTNVPSNTRERRSSSSKKSNENSLQLIQRRLETRVSIQSNLINHPIDLFLRRFLVNLIREIWTLDLQIRLGLIMLFAGLITRIFVYATWYVFYPRLAILIILFFASAIYLDPFDIQDQIKCVGDIIFSPEKAVEALERLDLQHLRRISFFLFLVPSFLEMRTLSFLSQIKAESGWTFYNLGVGASLLIAMLYFMKMKGMKPRDATYQGMLILYGSALLITIWTFDVRRMPFLAAPFLTATGTLLLTYRDNDMEWISRLIRHTIRLTLRDVLSSVGERVSEDEMLQLAILRWIADFWASNPAATATPAQNTSQSSEAQQSNTQRGSEQQNSNPQYYRHDEASTPPSDRDGSPTPDSSQDSATNPQVLPRDEMQWNELLPMLTVEIDHMEAEVEALQPYEGNSNDIPEHHYASQSHANSCSQNQQTQNTSNTHSFEALKSMLLSLNVDDRARPAVMAFKRAVESFPPKKRTAVGISILRRCPALLTLLFHILLGGTKSLLTSFIILCPFIVMEYYRMTGWIGTCQSIAVTTGGGTTSDGQNEVDVVEWGVPKELAQIDTMIILLCGDYHSALRPPTLLLVWYNIKSSVEALEVGLTAARCVETTAVAVDFAGNVMSLVQFGFEVSQHGLLHGLGIVVKEAISIHGMGGNLSNADGMNGESVRYTRAAIQTVHSGHKVVRNVQLLSEDENLGAVMQPVLMALGMLSGHGWLWGRSEVQETEASAINERHDSPIDGNENETQLENDRKRLEIKPMEQFTTSQTDTIVQNDGKNLSKFSEESSNDLPDPNNDNFASSSPSLSPQEELSMLMEMVASACEQGLIDPAEKAEFYEKLSRFKTEELYDPEVLSAMKRSLNIILENGITSPLNVEAKINEQEWIEDSSRISEHGQLDSGGSSTEMNAERAPPTEASFNHDISSSALEYSADDHDAYEQANFAQQSNIAQANPSQEKKKNNNNDSLIKLGVATLGVVAGGIALSMRGGERGANDDRFNNVNSTESEANEGRNQQSTVVIEELSDDDEKEDEWISVSE